MKILFVCVIVVVFRPIIPLVIEVDGQPPYLILGESYTLVCSTSSPTKSKISYWIKGGAHSVSKSNTLPLTNVTSDNMNISCIVFIAGDEYESPPLEIVVKDDVKYCSDVPKNCRGLKKTACSILYVCECGPNHRIKGKKCVEPIVPPVIEVEGQPPYLILGESYTLVCSTISHNENADYLWIGDDKLVLSDDRHLTLTEIASLEMKIICTIYVKNESATSPPLEIVVKDDVKYCSDIPNYCTGTLLNKTACSRLHVCECGPNHKIKANKCDMSGSRSLDMGTSFLILLICLVIEFL